MHGNKTRQKHDMVQMIIATGADCRGSFSKTANAQQVEKKKMSLNY